jgi:Glycosyl transferases group 1
VKIAYSGYFLDTSGYGEAARRLVWALRATGADVRHGSTLRDGGPVLKPGDEIDQFLETSHDHPDLHVIHAIPTDFPRVPRLATRTLGVTCWETTDLAQPFIDGCKSVDMLLVPSRQNLSLFAATGLRVGLVPYPLDPDSEMAPIAECESLTQPHIFYTIGTRQPRKNLEGTLTAILTATAGREDVAVVVKGGRTLMAVATLRQEIQVLIRELHLPTPPTVLVLGQVSPAQLRWLHRVKGTCYVSLSRGEGFGLPVLDAIGWGQTVVSSDWGGVADLLIEQNGQYRMGVYPVATRLTPVRQDYPLFSALQNWGDPDLLHAQLHLRAISARTKRTHYLRNMADYDPLTVGRVFLDWIERWISAT